MAEKLVSNFDSDVGQEEQGSEARFCVGGGLGRAFALGWDFARL